MGKILALLGFYGLDAAGVVRLQHDAGAIRGINEREPAAIALQVAELVDESHLIHAQKGCNGRNVLICQADITFPAAAGSATLAGVDDTALIRKRFLTHISQGLRVDVVICGGRT